MSQWKTLAKKHQAEKEKEEEESKHAETKKDLAAAQDELTDGAKVSESTKWSLIYEHY